MSRNNFGNLDSPVVHWKIVNHNNNLRYSDMYKGNNEVLNDVSCMNGKTLYQK